MTGVQGENVRRRVAELNARIEEQDNAREKEAILQSIRDLATNQRAILTGDFNTPAQTCAERIIMP